jgi:hypothetical protein
MKMIRTLLAALTLLLVQTAPLMAQIPASELPPPGADTGLEGKYDPQNGIAQVVRGEMKGVAIIFQDDHVVVFMPPDPVLAPGQLLVVPKRLGARNLLDLKPDEMRDLLVAVQKAAIAQKKWAGSNRFQSSTK